MLDDRDLSSMVFHQTALTPFEKSQKSFAQGNIEQANTIINHSRTAYASGPISFPARSVQFSGQHTANAHYTVFPHPREERHPHQLKHTHQCLVCNLGKLNTKIENMLLHQLEKACNCDHMFKGKKQTRKSH